MGIADELDALPQIDNIPAAIEQVRPIRDDLARRVAELVHQLEPR